MRKRVKHKRYHQIYKACRIMIFRFDKYRQKICCKNKRYLCSSGSLIHYFITVLLDTYDIIYYKRRIRKYHNQRDKKCSEDYKMYLRIRFWSSLNNQRRDYDELYETEKSSKV